MTAEIRAFVDVYSLKPKPPITVQEFIKEHNHEIWRTCQNCFHHFDIRKENQITSCPKCGDKNIK